MATDSLAPITNPTALAPQLGIFDGQINGGLPQPAGQEDV
jgi:hypothetical protein